MACPELSFRQSYSWNHSSVRSCLQRPGPGAGGARDLLCKEVCAARWDDAREAYRRAEEQLESSFMTCCVAMDENDNAIDESVIRQILQDVICSDENCGTCPTNAELELLLACGPSAPEELLDIDAIKARVAVLATLWHLVQVHRGEWLQCLRLPLRETAVMAGLRELNWGKAVQASEAAWLREKFLSIPCDHSLEEEKLLLCLACWYSSPQEPPNGLNKTHLLQRMRLEKQLSIGLQNFLVWATVFVLFAAALIKSGSLEHCRGIKGNLETQLLLEEANTVSAPRDIHAFAMRLSEHLSGFAPLSQGYFLGSQAWTLQDSPRTFMGKEALPHLMEPEPNGDGQLPVGLFVGKSFTLQSWVHVAADAPFLQEEGLSLLSKTMEVKREEVTCWSWRFPLLLRFGGHDYGPAAGNGVTGTFDEYVKVGYEVREELFGAALHTVIVNTSTATFMVGTEVVGSVALPRPVTDCSSEDVMLGDKGLTLASVRFIPRELSPSEVAQIYAAGLTWNEIARTTRPQKMKEAEVEEKHESNPDTWTSQIWAASTLLLSLPTEAEPETYNNAEHEVLPQAQDPVLGHAYWQMQGPSVYYGPSSRVSVPGTAIPQHEGAKGFSLSTWVRLTAKGYFLFLAMPLFSEADVQAGNAGNPIWTGFSNLCWAIWIGGNQTGFWLRSHEPHEKLQMAYFVADHNADSSWQFRGAAARHFVFSIDPANSSHPVRVCIDGMCTGHAGMDKFLRQDLNGRTPAASCLQTSVARAYPAAFREGMLNQTRLLMNHRYPYDHKSSGWQMQTKFYDTILSDLEVERLFKEEVDPADQQRRPIRETQGCRRAEEVTDDPTFRDRFGQDCQWYLNARKINEALCHEAARRACPQACSSWEACWGSATASSTEGHLLWSRQLDFQPRGEHGTMCVAKSTTAEREAIACASADHNRPYCLDHGNSTDCGPRDCSRFLPRLEDAEGRLAIRQELLQCIGNTQSWLGEQRNERLPCRDIILLERPDCAWDDSALEALAGQTGASGEWSMSFWYKGLSETECGEPQLRLLDTNGQLFMRLGSKFAPARFSGGVWHGPLCKWSQSVGLRTADSLGGAEVPRPTDRSRKHFALLGAKEAGKRIGVQVNRDENWEVQADPYTGKWRGLRVINVLGTVRLSSLQLHAAFPSRGHALSRYYTEQARQELRLGPLEKLESQVSRKELRQPTGYRQKTILLAPPIVLLKRRSEGVCANAGVVSSIYAFGQETHCQHPYQCANYEPSSIYKCPSGEEAAGKHFGERPLLISGEHYYMEFLDTLTSNAVIVREDDGDGGSRVRWTRDFVDLLTSEVQILSLFHSVEFGIMTLLKTSFDTRKGRVHVGSELSHSVSISDSALQECLILHGVCLACMLVFIASTAAEGMRTWRATKKALLRPVFDVLLAAVTCLLVCLLMLQEVFSEQETKEVLDKVLRFDWSGGSSRGIKEEFVRTVFEVDDSLFQGKTLLFKASTLLSLILLMRVVYTTSRHPRMELITRTIELASSDLMHFMGLMGVVLFGFALLGTWMFGQVREDFRSPLAACSTLVDTLLGPPGSLPIFDEGYSDVDLLYALVFHTICFFFLLNFVLAIIVDNYAHVQEEVKACTTDQSLPQDVWSVLRYRYLQLRHRFPCRERITDFLWGLRLETVVAADFHDGNLFEGPRAAEAFFRHYRSYDFLSADRETGDPCPEGALLMQKVDVLLDRLPSQLAPQVQALKEHMEGQRPQAGVSV